MINPIIKEQLEKVEQAKIGEYDPIKNCYHIPKYTEVEYKVDGCYLVSLDDKLLNPTSNEILVSNFNGGDYPRQKYMKISVVQKLGNNMIKVVGLYYDYINKVDINTMWSGWLPIDQLTLINEL